MNIAQALASGSYSSAVKLLDEKVKAVTDGNQHGQLSQLLSNRAYCYEQLNLKRKVTATCVCL
jgi:hypothetical protein